MDGHQTDRQTDRPLQKKTALASAGFGHFARADSRPVAKFHMPNFPSVLTHLTLQFAKIGQKAYFARAGKKK